MWFCIGCGVTGALLYVKAVDAMMSQANITDSWTEQQLLNFRQIDISPRVFQTIQSLCPTEAAQIKKIKKHRSSQRQEQAHVTMATATHTNSHAKKTYIQKHRGNGTSLAYPCCICGRV